MATDKERPLVGIVARQLPTRSGLIEGVLHNYVASLHMTGSDVVIIPPSNLGVQTPRGALWLDGLLLAGGEDIPTDWQSDPRTSTEALLIEHCLTSGVPLLGICRGMQLINVVLGGSTDMMASNVGANHLNPSGQPFVHPVNFSHGTRLHALFGDSIQVNSNHKYRLGRMADGVSMSAWAPDGVPEGIEIDSHPFAIGVQWHPEALALQTDEHALNLLTAFVEAAGNTTRSSHLKQTKWHS